jgi:hypothetical protein
MKEYLSAAEMAGQLDDTVLEKRGVSKYVRLLP